MRFSFVFVAFVFVSALWFCNGQQFQCSYQNLNFGQLAGQIYVGSDNVYTYNVDICSDLSSGPTVPPVCDGSGVCQTVSGQSQAFALGEWSTAVWDSVISNNQTIGASALLKTNTNSCWTVSGPQPYYSTIQFVCPTGEEEDSPNNAMTVKQTGACSFQFTIQTTFACTIPPVNNCAYQGRDFSALAGHVFTAQDSAYTYQFSPCTALLNSTCQSASSICQEPLNNPSTGYDLGNFNAASSWSYIDPQSPATGVALNMIGTQSCWTSGGVVYFNSTVLFKCSQHTSTTMQVTNNNECDFQFVIPTPLACPP